MEPRVGQTTALLSQNSGYASSQKDVKAPKHLNANKLKIGAIKQSFAATLEELLESIVLDDQDAEAAWGVLRETVYTSTMECLGPTSRQHKDWFDENCAEITQLLEIKCCVYKAHLDNPTSTAEKDALRKMCSTIQLKVRQMQDLWLSNKADDIQGYADRKDMKKFYDGLEETYGPTTSGSSPLLKADRSSLITDEDKILERWAEHFDSGIG